MLENRPALFTGNSSELISSEGMFPGIASIEKHHQEFLTTTPRYERFMTGESIEEWVGLLGVDVLSLGHPYATGDIAMQFAECNDRGGLVTSGTDKFTIFIASHIHDFGEIIDGVGGVGDISHDKKQENDRRQEEVVFQRVLERCVSNQVEALLYNQIYSNVVHGDKSKGLARQFNAIERIGYLLTAHQAFVGVNGKRIGNWRGLVGNVLSNQTGRLVDYTEEYPMVKNVLGVLRNDITTMFQETVGSVPAIDNEGSLSFDSQRLQRASDDWNNYLAA